MRHIAVFDTNVLLSALGWKGKPYQCVELARAGTIDGLTCREIIVELAEKLQVKLPFSPEQVTEVLADLLSFLRVVSMRSMPTQMTTRCWNVARSAAQQISSVEIVATSCRWEPTPECG